MRGRARHGPDPASGIRARRRSGARRNGSRRRRRATDPSRRPAGGHRALWRTVFESLLDAADAAQLVHPSWWSPRRAAAVADAARGVVDAVTTSPRHRLLHRGAVFVEIGRDFVAIGDHKASRRAETRWAAADTSPMRSRAAPGLTAVRCTSTRRWGCPAPRCARVAHRAPIAVGRSNRTSTRRP